jgi:hypothetical protein
MFVSPKKPHVPTAPTVRFVLLPGPDRKRTRSPYGYRLIHRAADASQPGCVMSWEVWGGRLLYQVALERLEGGDLRWHCTCPDWIYRAENEGRWCKHIHGLLQIGRVVGEPIPVLMPNPALGA